MRKITPKNFLARCQSLVSKHRDDDIRGRSTDGHSARTYQFGLTGPLKVPKMLVMAAIVPEIDADYYKAS
jgi:hypothetical protein